MLEFGGGSTRSQRRMGARLLPTKRFQFDQATLGAYRTWLREHKSLPTNTLMVSSSHVYARFRRSMTRW